jgi:predicted nucleic acid-binding protein
LIIVDASVMANALTDDGPVGHAARTELAQDAHWSGPEHVVVEAFSAIRGRLLGRKITKRRAHDAVDTLAAATIELLPTTPLLPRMWQLRDNISGYDAAYVAAAETHGCALLTADARLSRVSGLHCQIRLGVP